MLKRQRDMNRAELERALATQENGSTGQQWAAARQEVQPRPEFVQRLEGRLRASGRAGATLAARRPWPWLAWSPQRSAVASASLLALVLLSAFFWLNGAAPVSAQQVLERAAAGRMLPNQIMYRVYRLEQVQLTPHTGSAEVWLQADAAGYVAHSAMTFTSYADDGAVASVKRIVTTGAAAQGYDYNAADNTLVSRSGTYDDVNGGEPNYFNGVSVAHDLALIAQGGVRRVSLLPPQTFDGVSVLAVRVVSSVGNSTENVSAYFDAQSYVLRGMEMPGGRVWLSREEARTALDLSPQTFSLNPPANAKVTIDNSHAQQPGDGNVEIQAVMKFCHVSKAALTSAQQAGQTTLAVCQSGRPGVTATELLDVLLVPVEVQWDADVAAGRITSAQRADYATNVRRKLAIWISSPLSQ